MGRLITKIAEHPLSEYVKGLNQFNEAMANLARGMKGPEMTHTINHLEFEYTEKTKDDPRFERAEEV